MLISGENATTLKHQSTIEAITSITQSLANSKEPAKKLRHSLKNLCFYSPDQNLLGPLCDILEREMKEETKCFKLTCFHIISHAHFAYTAPIVPSLLDKIAKTITSKNITEQASYLYRVLFFLASRLPSCTDLLIKTTISLLSNPPSEITKVQKKGLFGKENVTPLLPLIHEVVSLLVDLPDFERSAIQILRSDGMPRKLAEIYKILALPYKQRILHFLGRLETIPEDLIKIGTKEDFSSLATLQFLARHRDAYPELETVIMGNINHDQFPFYLYLLARLGTKDSKIFEKIMQMKGDLFSVYLTWLHVKNFYPTTSFATVAQRLYVATTNSNPTIALAAFKVLISPEVDQQWLQSSFKSILDNFNPIMRMKSFASLAKTINVMSMPDDEDGFEIHYLPLIRIIFENYVDMVTEKPFEEFMRGIAEKRLSRLFLSMAAQLLSSVPALDSVIYMFYGASLLEKVSDPGHYAAFKAKAEEYLQNADPSLSTVYRTLILRQ